MTAVDILHSETGMPLLAPGALTGTLNLVESRTAGGPSFHVWLPA